MMDRVRLEPNLEDMTVNIYDVSAFPGKRFGLGFPEAVGDAARVQWPNAVKVSWSQEDHGAWRCRGGCEGVLSYELLLSPFEDFVEATYTLTNLGEDTWSNGMAFNCFQCGAVPELRDYECLRHWVRVGGAFKRLPELPRVYGPRPVVQLYSVEGAPPGEHVPFVKGFDATPGFKTAGWIAIVSRDGKRLAATVSDPALFLFQNMEYSCIHSGTDFGRMPPGATSSARNRVYFVEASLDSWHSRMVKEMGS